MKPDEKFEKLTTCVSVILQRTSQKKKHSRVSNVILIVFKAWEALVGQAIVFFDASNTPEQPTRSMENQRESGEEDGVKTRKKKGLHEEILVEDFGDRGTTLAPLPKQIGLHGCHRTSFSYIARGRNAFRKEELEWWRSSHHDMEAVAPRGRRGLVLGVGVRVHVSCCVHPQLARRGAASSWFRQHHHHHH